jgi:intracellular multiplication protein IcmK
MKKLFFVILFSLLSFVTISSLAADADLTNAAPVSSSRPNSDLQDKVKQLQLLLSQAQQQRQAGQTTPTTATTNAATTTGSPTVDATTTTVTTPAPTTNTNAASNEPDMYEQAFTNVVNQLLPMTPEQIAHLREAFNEAQRAAATPVGIPPKPTSSSVIVDLAPQAASPVIRLQAGYISSLVFLDSTGQPWPISAYSLGDPTAFNIQWDHKGNTLLIQSVTFYKRCNLAVILKGLNTPVMLTLIPGQEAVDYRVDLRIPGLGPNAAFTQGGLPDSANPLLLDVLNGVPPPGAKTLHVNGGSCQAWLLGKTMFLRTTLDVISPAWKSQMSSIDGTHAYELQPAPVVLALEHGKDKTITLTLEGWE